MRIGNRKDKVKPMAKANTLAILDSIRKSEHSNVSQTTQYGVEEAKSWVEDNQK